MEILYLALGILVLLIGGYILFVFPIQFNNYFKTTMGQMRARGHYLS